MVLKQLQMEVNEMKEAISMLLNAMDKISNQQQVINSLVKEMAQVETLNAKKSTGLTHWQIGLMSWSSI